MKPRLLVSLLAFILIAGPVLSAQSAPASLVLTTGFFDELTVFFLACGPFVILAAACALWYGHALKKGRRFKFVDFLAGLFQMGAIAALYVAYGEATGENLFFDIIVWEPLSDFWMLVVRCLWILLFFAVWTLLVRFVFKAGPNWMLHLVTLLFFGLMTIYYAFDFLGRASLLCGILGLGLIPFTAFIGYCVIYFRFVNFTRCPVCHASGSRNIAYRGNENLGLSTDHSTEYRNRTEKETSSGAGEYQEVEKRISEKYDVYKTRENYRHYMCCNKCGYDWSADTSHTINTDKDLNSVKTETTTTTWRRN